MKGGSSLSRKDEMYNELVEVFEKRDLSFPKGNTDGSYFIQVCFMFKIIYINLSKLFFIDNNISPVMPLNRNIV